ncbi:MAG: TonB-dependent receptor [Pyrinomonadaceae bacterium]
MDSRETDHLSQPFYTRGRLTTLAITILLVLGADALAQDVATIAGQIVDRSGAAVASARVRWVTPDGKTRAATESDEAGRFSLRASDIPVGEIVVEASGFETHRYRLMPDSGAGPVRIELAPAALAATVTVTRAATRIEDSPEPVVTLTRGDLESSAAATLDDKLRQVPGFSLFRRAGSRTANPTTQGVSLRGVGASGASRALVLADGATLNDPFGGWVYWGRVPAGSIERVEVLRGPASDLYGTSAVGGVVSIVTRRGAEVPLLDVEFSAGTQRSPLVSAYASAGMRDWFGSLAVEAFRTSGFVTVDERERGAVDTKANVRRLAVSPRVERAFGSSRVFAAPSFYEERRSNGTPLQTNDTRIASITVGADVVTRAAGALNLRATASRQSYHQTFSAVAPGRASESLTRLQSSPSQSASASITWLRSANANLTTFAGAELREVRGRSDETGFAGGAAGSLASSGGRESAFGAYAGGTASVLSRRVTLGGGVRYDRWRGSHGYASTLTLRTGARSTTRFDDRGESAVSPRASLLVRVNDNVSLTASARLGFRQPTLNELYRSFRVGDVLTQANAALRAERAAALEAGAIFTANGGRTYLRSDVFCTEITRNIANVTIAVTPALTTRQRQNLGRTRSCGVEADAQHRVSSVLSLSAGYLFVDPRVESFAANRMLEGRLVPQTPRHSFTAQMNFADPRIANVGIQLRASSRQYEDDLNQTPLAAYASVDAFVSRRIARGAEVFAAAENLFDTRIESGRTPVTTLAGRRELRLGLRLNLGRR